MYRNLIICTYSICTACIAFMDNMPLLVGSNVKHDQEMPSLGKNTSRWGASEDSFGEDWSCHKIQATHSRWLQLAYSKSLAKRRTSGDTAYWCRAYCLQELQKGNQAQGENSGRFPEVMDKKISFLLEELPWGPAKSWKINEVQVWWCSPLTRQSQPKTHVATSVHHGSETRLRQQGANSHSPDCWWDQYKPTYAVGCTFRDRPGWGGCRGSMFHGILISYGIYISLLYALHAHIPLRTYLGEVFTTDTMCFLMCSSSERNVNYATKMLHMLLSLCEDQWKVVWFLWAKGHNLNYILRDMCGVYGEDCMDCRNISRWCAFFKELPAWRMCTTSLYTPPMPLWISHRLCPLAHKNHTTLHCSLHITSNMHAIFVA